MFRSSLRKAVRELKLVHEPTVSRSSTAARMVNSPKRGTHRSRSYGYALALGMRVTHLGSYCQTGSYNGCLGLRSNPSIDPCNAGAVRAYFVGAFSFKVKDPFEVKLPKWIYSSVYKTKIEGVFGLRPNTSLRAMRYLISLSIKRIILFESIWSFDFKSTCKYPSNEFYSLAKSLDYQVKADDVKRRKLQAKQAKPAPKANWWEVEGLTRPYEPSPGVADQGRVYATWDNLEFTELDLQMESGEESEVELYEY